MSHADKNFKEKQRSENESPKHEIIEAQKGCRVEGS